MLGATIEWIVTPAAITVSSITHLPQATAQGITDLSRRSTKCVHSPHWTTHCVHRGTIGPLQLHVTRSLNVHPQRSEVTAGGSYTSHATPPPKPTSCRAEGLVTCVRLLCFHVIFLPPIPVKEEGVALILLFRHWPQSRPWRSSDLLRHRTTRRNTPSRLRRWSRHLPERCEKNTRLPTALRRNRRPG